jgi:hypothetical protein
MEEMKMKRTALSVLVVLMLAIAPLTAFAAETQLEGSVQGFTCVTQGKICPVGKEDPMAGVERVFVLLTSGNDYYFIPNVDRAILARHLNDRIRVTGELNGKYKSINATKIEVMKKGMWERVWGTADELDLLKDLSLPKGI